MSYIRPSAEALDEPFWRAISGGRLEIQSCARCGHLRHPPQPICARCSSFEDKWVEASGEATVYSFTVIHHPAHPAVAAWVPYVTAMVELKEGVRMISMITGVAPDEVKVGMKVRCVFKRMAPDFQLPLFEPAEAGAGKNP